MEPFHIFVLYTESKNVDVTLDLAGEIFPKGLTVHSANGYWQGQREASLVLTCIVPAKDADLARISVEELAKKINTLNAQHATLIVETIGWGRLVEEKF